MPYRLVFTRRASRDFRSLAPDVRHRIADALNRFSESPLQHARKMASPELGEYRFRIGDYRVIFDLEGHDIVVLRVGHRSEIYRS